MVFHRDPGFIFGQTEVNLKVILNKVYGMDMEYGCQEMELSHIKDSTLLIKKMDMANLHGMEEIMNTKGTLKTIAGMG